MALSDAQFQLIQKTLKAVGVDSGDREDLASDVRTGLDKLAQMMKSLSPDTAFTYNPEDGFEDEIRQLQESLDAAAASDAYQQLRGLRYDNVLGDQAGKLSVQAAIFAEGVQLPQAILDDVDLLFELVDNRAQYVGAFSQAERDGLLQVVQADTPENSDVQTEGVEREVPDSASQDQPQEQPEDAGEETSQEASEEPPQPAQDPAPTPGMAAIMVEMALAGQGDQGGLSKMLNDALEKKSADLAGVGAGGGFLGEFLRSALPHDLLNIRLPENISVDGHFDMRSQTALQGMMMVLSHSQVLGMEQQFPGIPAWKYIPAKGAYILDNIEKLKEVLGPEAAEAMEAHIDKLPKIIEALNVLYDNNMLADYALYQGSPLEIGELTGNIFFDETQRLQGVDGANELFNELTFLYTQFRLDSFMDAAQLPEMNDSQEVDISKRLSAFYDRALKSYQDGGHTQEDFESFMFMSVLTITHLPMGTREQRDLFNNDVRLALQSGDGETFSRTVLEAMERIEAEGPVRYVRPMDEGGSISRDPKLFSDDFKIISNGQTFSGLDIVKAYNNVQIAKAPDEFKKTARHEVVSLHAPLFFKDDAGKLHVAAIDSPSMTFTAQEIDVDKIRQVLQEQGMPKADMSREDWQNLTEHLRAADDGFALVFQDGGSNLYWSVGDFLNLIEDPKAFRPLHEVDYDFRTQADDIRAAAEARRNRPGYVGDVPIAARASAGQGLTGAFTEHNTPEEEPAPAIPPNTEQLEVIEKNDQGGVKPEDLTRQ